MGIWIGNDYGVSTDEYLNAKVGARALSALISSDGYTEYLKSGEILAHHGPSYFMVFAGISKWVTSVFTTWHAADGRHFTNFLTLLLGTVIFYSLCKRLLPGRIAIVTTALFALQPVVFGHGFINQKDMPFMVFFMACLAAGFWVTDREDATAESQDSQHPVEMGSSLWRTFWEDWIRSKKPWKVIFIAVLVLFLLLVMDLFIFGNIFRYADRILDLAHEGRAVSILNRLFLMVAEDAKTAPYELYRIKLIWLYGVLGRMALFLMGVVILLVAARKVLPAALRRLFAFRGKVALLVVLAGFILGFTISIRVVAGFAGVLVSGYWLYRYKSKAIGLLILYWVTAGIVTYETWPYLWESPFATFVQSLAFHTGFENHDVLYRGVIYRSDSLPWHFLPTLFTLQLTEPVIPVFLVGAVTGLIMFIKKRSSRALLVIVTLWLLVPFAGTFLPGTVQFNNFRHMLFLVPPIFFFVGLGLEFIAARIPNQWVKLLLLVGILMPGIWGIVSLHPYEYSFFNSLAGGVEGAAGTYDVEYWCTSYREAIEYINEVAPTGAYVFIRRPIYNALYFERPDITLTKDADKYQLASYVVICPHYQDAEWAEGSIVYEVGHGSAVFAQIYQRESVMETPLTE
ncbi:MAG: hypothetical protein E4G99_01560 [Anaerolineales bacterium]|nr:MAG: hypothetical protein E4G99_01560 [Anaerolineales bacterium]